MINTSWDDDGENLFNQTWYPFAWGGEIAWNPSDNNSPGAWQKNFDDAFSAVFYGARMIRSASSCGARRSAEQPGQRRCEDRNFWRDNLTDPDPKVTSTTRKNSLPTPTTSPMRRPEQIDRDPQRRHA